MSSSRFTKILALSIVFSLLPLTVAAGGGDGGNSDFARAEHQRIVDFWTHERVAQAVPRDFILDPETGRFSPAKKPPGTPGGGPGNGGGGNGGGNGDDTTVVSGSSWKKGGEIDGASGKVLFRMGNSYYICSAVVIFDTANDRSLILTAAHCVYDEVNQVFATEWTFIPDYDDSPAPLTTSGSYCSSTAYGCWTALKMVVHSGYATAGGFNDQAVVHDYAVVAVGEGGHGGGTILEDVVDEQAYDFGTTATGDTGYAFGYPAEKKWKGNDLIYCRGPIDTDPLNSNDTYRMADCKLNGGSSGGPWLIDFVENTGAGTVVSVNSYGYKGINAMHGPMLDSKTAAVYNAASTSTGNTTVSGG